MRCKYIKGLSTSYEERLQQITDIAQKYTWWVLDYQENIGLISFSNAINDGVCRINIYVSKMTVSTSLDHPKQGKTQLFRRSVDKTLLTSIFKNPRVHTNRGYQKK